MIRISHKLLILLLFSVLLGVVACDSTDDGTSRRRPRVVKKPDDGNEIVNIDPKTFTRCDGTDECKKGEEICSGNICVGLNKQGVDLCKNSTLKDQCEKKGLKCENNRCVPNCDQLCGGVCCGKGESCFHDQCTSVQCNTGTDMCATSTGIKCCSVGEGCVANTCVKLDSICDNAVDYCPLWQFCELKSHSNCVNYDDVDLCTLEIPEQLEAELVLSWGETEPTSWGIYRNVMSSPVVGYFHDTTQTEAKDPDVKYPDIVFNAFIGNIYGKGILRVIGGRPDTLSYTNTRERFNSQTLEIESDRFYTAGEHSPAIGDINNNGKLEVVTALEYGGGMIAIDYDQKIVWKNTEIRVPTASATAIANLDHDGAAEILVGKYVLDGSNGKILCTLKEENLTPVAIDLDESDNMEIIHGGRIYSFERTASGATCTDTTPNLPAQAGEVFAAVANVIESTNTPEIVTVYNGSVKILDHRGNKICQYDISDGTGGGPPTLSNFDNSGDLEIAVATPSRYTLINSTCQKIWSFENTKDTTSGITGSSLFDFDGDGKAEIIYNDEEVIRIFSDKNGTQRNRITPITNSNFTKIEFPVIVDLTGDGHANLIASANTAQGGDQQGIRVYSDPKNRWLGTRRIWNQHTYHATNVEDDGSIPLNEKPHWKKAWSNNFRQNVQKGNLRFAPNLKVKLAAIYNSACSDSSSRRDISFTIYNDGEKDVPARATNAKLSVSEAGKNVFKEIATINYGRVIKAGGNATISYVWNVPPTLQGKKLDIKVVVDPDDKVAECKNTDNEDLLTDIATVAPNLSVNIVDGGATTCTSISKFAVKFEVRNNGAGIAKAGAFDINIYGGTDGNLTKLGTVHTTKDLRNGEYDTIVYEIPVGDNYNRVYDVKVVVDEGTVAEPFGKLLECNETDNDATIETICYLFG